MAKDDLPVYKITIDPAYAENGEDLGIEMIAFTAKPAIKVMGMAFNSQAKPMIFTDNVKYRIVAPALIPMEIYRKDDDDKEYYVSFSKEEIEKIHAKFMQDMSNKDLFNLEHDADKKVPAYVLEAWVVDTPLLDKAYSSFGIEVPEGTLMVTAQVTDKDYYDELVKEGQVGFSVEGYLGMKLKEQQQLKLNNMNKLPDGEHTIEDKIYVVKNGEITEIRDAELKEASEEVALDETVVEEEVVEDTMAVDPALDAEAVLEIVRPMLEEKINEILVMIADIKAAHEELLNPEEVVEVEATTAVSNAQKLSMFNKFNNQ